MTMTVNLRYYCCTNSVDSVACRVGSCVRIHEHASMLINQEVSMKETRNIQSKDWLLKIQHYHQQNHQWNIDALPTAKNAQYSQCAVLPSDNILVWY